MKKELNPRLVEGLIALLGVSIMGTLKLVSARYVDRYYAHHYAAKKTALAKTHQN